MIRLQVDLLSASALWLGIMACTTEPEPTPEPVSEWTEHTLEVTATAYNSVTRADR